MSDLYVVYVFAVSCALFDFRIIIAPSLLSLSWLLVNYGIKYMTRIHSCFGF